MIIELETVVKVMQNQIGKCSYYCKHYRDTDDNDFYCDHPLSGDAEDIIMDNDMGMSNGCVFWEGNIGFCEKHEIVFVGECPKCVLNMVQEQRRK